MTLSAAFTVGGASNPAVHRVAYGSTVSLALTSTDGATSIVWEIMGCSEPTESIPAITLAGSPPGATASFVFPTDSGDTLGRAFLVRCTTSNQIREASGAYQSSIEYAVIGADNSQGEVPIVPGEGLHRHGTHGWAPEVNRALNNSGGGGGGGYATIRDEGVALTQRTSIDFVGAGVTATDIGGWTRVTIPGGDIAPTGSAIGQVQIWNGSTWIAGATDLADTDAVTGILPAARGGTGIGGAGGTANRVLVTTDGSTWTAGQVTTGGITDGNVTLAKLANGTAASVLGRSAATGGVYADIVSTADGQALIRAAGVLTWGTVGDLKSDGTVAMAADFNLNSHKAVGMSPGTVGTDGVNLNQLNAAATSATQPFKATYYVNPAFVGTSTGSQSNPFTTIAAAFAAAASAGYTGGTFKLPPSTTVTENVVFPTSGGDWEIMSEQGFSNSTIGSVLVGSVTINAAGGAILHAKLTNIVLNGNITGDGAGAGTKAIYTGTVVRHVGTITLTSSSGGVCAAFLRGLGAPDANKYCGSNSQLVSVAGLLKASNWVFEGGITEAHGLFTPYPGSQFQECWFGSTTGSSIPIGLNGASLNVHFYDCLFVGPTTFTSSVANYVVYLDGPSRTSLNRSTAGSTFVNCAPNAFSGTLTVSRAVTATIASTATGGLSMPGLYEGIALLDITSGSGSVVVNAIYTDRGGTLRTEAILSGTIAAGKLRSSTLPFRHDGTTAIAYSVTVTGTISAWLDMSINLRS